jgi:hypothetical protein
MRSEALRSDGVVNAAANAPDYDRRMLKVPVAPATSAVEIFAATDDGCKLHRRGARQRKKIPSYQGVSSQMRRVMCLPDDGVLGGKPMVSSNSYHDQNHIMPTARDRKLQAEGMRPNGMFSQYMSACILKGVNYQATGHV